MTRFLAVLLLAGCSEPDPKETPKTGTETGTPVGGGTPTGTPTGGSTDPYCADQVVATWPENGRTNAYYRTEIAFTMNPAPDPSDAIVLTEGGTAVAGSSEVRGDQVVFVPAAPLAPSTTYEAALADCPPSAITFTTSIAGAPVDTAGLIGTTYAVDIESGRWLEPAGIGTILSGSLTVDILVGVVAADASTVTVLGAVSEETSADQDLCVETVDFPAADFTSNPYFEIGPRDFFLTVQGASVDMMDVHISGSFRPDFNGIEGATLTGTLDTRSLVDAIDPGGPSSAVCDLLATLGVACVMCPDLSGSFCVDAVVDDLVAFSAPGPLVPRTAYDIAGDGACP